MQRGGDGNGGNRGLPKAPLAPSAAVVRSPSLDPDAAAPFRDSSANALCSRRHPSSIGTGPSATAASFSYLFSRAAALRAVNAYLSPAVTLRPPCPAARDIRAAFRCLLDRLGFPGQHATFEDNLLLLLRQLGCPYKLTRFAFEAAGTPNSWLPILSVLHWLTLLSRGSDNLRASSPSAGDASNDVLFYITQGYSYFIRGGDDAVACLDEEFISNARAHTEAAVRAHDALEEETEKLEAKMNKLTAGNSSRQEELLAKKELLTAEVEKLEAFVNASTAKINEKQESLVDLGKELEAKVIVVQHMAAQNEELLNKVEAQAKLHREMEAVEHVIAKVENGMAALEEKGLELEDAVFRKLEELDRLTEQCNHALKKLKPGIDFQYMLNVKGSSAAEILRLSYKIVLKPALNAHAEKTKSVSIPKLDEPVDLQKKLHKDSTIREEKRNNLSSLKAKTDAVEDKKEPFLALSLSELQGVKSPLNKVQKMLKVYTRRKFKNGQQLDKVQKVLKVYTRRKFRKLLPAQSGSASVFPNGTSVAINQEMQEKLVITKDSSICRVRKGNGKTTTPLVDKGLRRSSRLNGQNDGYKQVQFSSPEKGKPRGRHAKKKAENTLP